MRDRRLGGDEGVTLVELLVATALMMTISGVMAMALSVTLRSDRAASARLAASHDAQLVSIYLPSDIQSARPESITAAAVDALPGCDRSPEFEASTNVVAFGWPQTEGLAVSYRIDAEGELLRFECVSSNDLESLIVGHNLTSAEFIETTVTMTVSETSGFTYSIAGHPRTPASPPPPPPPPAPPALPPPPPIPPCTADSLTVVPDSVDQETDGSLTSDLEVQLKTVGLCVTPFTVEFTPDSGPQPVRSMPLSYDTDDSAWTVVIPADAYVWTPGEKVFTAYEGDVPMPGDQGNLDVTAPLPGPG